MTLAYAYNAILGGLIDGFGAEITTATTLIGAAMLLATVGFMVLLAIGPYYSSAWAERLAASTGEFESGSSDARSGESA